MTIDNEIILQPKELWKFQEPDEEYSYTSKKNHEQIYLFSGEVEKSR